MSDPTTELRRSVLIRVAVSVVMAGGITAAAIVALWSQLDIKTDVVGNPVFSDFNGQNYFRAYYLVAGFFPLAALALFLLLTRLGPRFGLAAPLPRGRLHPPAAPPPNPSLDEDPPLEAQPTSKRRAVTAARIGFVGAVLGLEAGIAADQIWLGLVGGIAIYGLAVLGSAAALQRRGGTRSLEQGLPVVNAIAAPLTVLGLFVVSANTEVRVLANGSADNYPWFPIWLALPAAALLAGVLASRLRHSGTKPVEVERRALLLVAVPVCLFLLLAFLPGHQLTFETFEAGQRLAAGQLVGDGFFPWRDVFVAHGVLADVIHPLFGFAVFDDSYWGDLAGNFFILGPAYLIAWYFVFAYLFGRNWLFLLLCAVVILDRTIAPPDFRMILWPLILLLLASALNRPTRLKSVGLAFLAVGQGIVTPESAPALVALAVVVVLYEWYWREPGMSFSGAFPRTIWFGGAGIVFVGALAGYLAIAGALDDLVFITVNLLQAHSIDGAIPPGERPPTRTSTSWRSRSPRRF